MLDLERHIKNRFGSMAVLATVAGALGYQRIMRIHGRNDSAELCALRSLKNIVGSFNRGLPFGVDEIF